MRCRDQWPRSIARGLCRAAVPVCFDCGRNGFRGKGVKTLLLTPYRLVGMETGGRPIAMVDAPHQSKTKLLDATLSVVRRKGYAATRVEDVCAEAGVTKGSFF